VARTTASSLRLLAEEARGCRACRLWERGTQTVFGEGPATARLVLVGEQPGDEEDKAGHPFVGPAGRLLDKALAEAGIERRRIYVTNAVKHFKWEPRGKRRIHQRPNRTEIVACHRWLEGELEALADEAVLVALGAVAGEALFGPSYRVGKARGTVLELDGRLVVPTIHPSAVLRADRGPDWDALYGGFVADLARARELAA
jgi:uracil-DNA glycosylase family protein